MEVSFLQELVISMPATIDKYIKILIDFIYSVIIKIGLLSCPKLEIEPNAAVLAVDVRLKGVLRNKAHSENVIATPRWPNSAASN